MFIVGKQRFSVLIIEDAVNSYILTKEKLESLYVFVDVDWKESVEDGLLALTTSNTYDLILLNYAMCKNLKVDPTPKIIKLAKNTPVVLLPSSNLYREIKKYGGLGFLFESHAAINGSLISFKGKPENRTTFDIFPAPAILLDLNSEKIQEVNLAAQRLLEFNSEDLKGVDLEQIASPMDRVIFKKYLTDKEFAIPQVFYLLKSSGQKIIAEFSGTLIDTNKENLLLLHFRDITEHLNKSAQLEIQKKRLREVSYIQSHLLRAPIARLLALASALEDKSLEEKERILYMKSVAQSAQELDFIVREMGANLEENSLSFTFLSDQIFG